MTGCVRVYEIMCFEGCVIGSVLECVTSACDRVHVERACAKATTSSPFSVDSTDSSTLSTETRSSKELYETSVTTGVPTLSTDRWHSDNCLKYTIVH